VSEKRIVYVCVGKRHPVKASIRSSIRLESGTRFEFEGGMVEIVNVYSNPSGTQLEVTEV